MTRTNAKKINQVQSDVEATKVWFLIVVLALLLMGLVMVYSASSIEAINEGSSPLYYVLKQTLYAVVGVGLAYVLWKIIPFDFWRSDFVYVIWIAAVCLLLLTALIGITRLGAQRWIVLGPISLQPSEFAKIAVVMISVKIYDDWSNGKNTLKTVLTQVGIFILMPLLLIYFSQSDFGTTLICLVGIITVLWLGGFSMALIVAVVVIVLIFVVFAVFFVGYRSDRMIFLNPWNDGANGYGTGYQLIHSFYAFSEGGLFGVGIGNSREKFLYLPEAETDFIFAVIGEELGMIGALFVIVLFLVFLCLGLKIARSAVDNYAATLAGSLTFMIVFQAFLNIGCVIGLLPTTGKPLPFISSGGSSLIATFLMIGLILAVCEERLSLRHYNKKSHGKATKAKMVSGR